MVGYSPAGGVEAGGGFVGVEVEDIWEAGRLVQGCLEGYVGG